jgi:hypothetical protein
MRRSLALLSAALLTACGAGEPYEYPDAARTEFHAVCPASDPVCACTWDGITRTMPHDEYEAIMQRFRDEGLMDPRLTRVRAKCREDAAG